MYGIDQIHEHLADVSYYQDYINRYYGIEVMADAYYEIKEMLGSEFRSKLTKLYDKFEQLTDDNNWIKIYRKYRGADYRLDRSIRKAVSEIDVFLIKYFLEHE
jgi:hypothetical protein